MLRSKATFDLLTTSTKQLNHQYQYTMKPSTLQKTSKRVRDDTRSPNIHDAVKASMFPETINFFEITSSASSSCSTCSSCCNNDHRAAFSLSSLMHTDGPATRALENSIRLSKRRSADPVETTTPTINGGCKASPKKRNKPCENNSATLTCNVPVLNDWSNVYNCLITTDETIEPFPNIEYIFDEPDIIPLHP